jgi:thymidine kinase
LSQEADYVILNDTNILSFDLKDKKLDCILVDEVQFLNPDHIDQLRMATHLWRVPIFCYGLRTDFRSNLFPGSKRLMEIADSIEEVKTTCHYCHRTATLNLKHVNGVADCTGFFFKKKKNYFAYIFKYFIYHLIHSIIKTVF